MSIDNVSDRKDTILIVDDDTFNRELLGEFIDILGYSAAFARSGSEALERLGPDISLVLLDVLMPTMDGFEATRRIRSHPLYSDIPIILVTAITNREGKLRGVEAGANDFISKPIDLTELRVRLSAQLKMRRATQALAAVHEHELAIAAEIQSTLLLGQSPVDIPGVNIAAFTESSAKIDGDFYHFFVYNDQHFDIAVGDVMGKGIPAAVLGAAVKSAIQKAISRSLVDVHGSFPRPEHIVGRVHRDMSAHLIRLGTFVTLAYAHVDMESRQIFLVDCGHTRMVHFKASDKTYSMVQGDNMPLGVVEEETHVAIVIPFSPGDVFALYSDGLTDAEDIAGEPFGESRLADVVAKNSSSDSDAIVTAVRAAVQDFTGTTVITDDVTCVVFKFGDPLKADVEEAVLDIRSSLDHLEEVGAFVRGFLSQSPSMTEADVDAMELVVNEAIVNIIDHAYEGQADLPISIHAMLTPGSATIRVYDWAEPFDAKVISPPVLDGSRFEGFGLFIIQENTSSVAYTRDPDGRNCGTFVRQLPFFKAASSN